MLWYISYHILMEVIFAAGVVYGCLDLSHTRIMEFKENELLSVTVLLRN
jgi:hypothetical protein